MEFDIVPVLTSASLPIRVLLSPLLTVAPASLPTAVLLLELALTKATDQVAVLSEPLPFHSAKIPVATLFEPVVF